MSCARFRLGSLPCLLISAVSFMSSGCQDINAPSEGQDPSSSEPLATEDGEISIDGSNQRRLEIPTPSAPDIQVYSTGSLGEAQFVVENGPDHIIGLRQSPASMEGQLSEGVCLVLCAGLWSQHHLRAIDTAIRGIEPFSSRARLALPPFNKWEEIEAWCPEYRFDDHRNYAAIWILLVDGAAVDIRSGYLKVEEIAEMVQPHIDE